MSRLRRATREPVSLFAFQDIIFSGTAIMLLIAITFSLSETASRINSAKSNPSVAAEIRRHAAEITGLQSKIEIVRAWQAAGQPDLVALRAIPAHPAAELLALRQTTGSQGQENLTRLRDDLLAVEQRAQQDVLKLTAAREKWLEIKQQILRLEKESDTLLVVDRLDDSTLEPVLILVAKDWIDFERAGRPDLRQRLPGPLTPERLVEAVARFAPEQHFLWFGLRPAGAIHYTALRAAALARRLTFTFEPIGEKQTVNFHSRERALELLK